MLRVTGQRADGFHEIQTVFQFLDYGDQIAFKLTTGQIKRHKPIPGVATASDLTLRAAALLQRSAKVSQGVEIFLRKRLPVGGGVGGGSSDAATTLLVLNQLWGIGYPESELISLGRTLGADVPIFILGKASWAEGVGDKFTPIDLVEPWYLVIKPEVCVATAGVFHDPMLPRNSSAITSADFLGGDARNDCVAVVCRQHPVVKQVIDWLQEHQAEAKLTGTGACIFSAFTTRDAASHLASQVPSAWSFFIAKGKNLSPLLEKFS